MGRTSPPGMTKALATEGRVEMPLAVIFSADRLGRVGFLMIGPLDPEAFYRLCSVNRGGHPPNEVASDYVTICTPSGRTIRPRRIPFGSNTSYAVGSRQWTAVNFF